MNTCNPSTTAPRPESVLDQPWTHLDQPWTLHYYGGLNFAVGIERGGIRHVIANIPILLERNKSAPTAEEWELANCIAAASLLLKSLKDCLFVLDDTMDGFGPTKRTAIAEAKAVIARISAGPQPASSLGEPSSPTVCGSPPDHGRP